MRLELRRVSVTLSPRFKTKETVGFENRCHTQRDSGFQQVFGVLKKVNEQCFSVLQEYRTVAPQERKLVVT